MLVFLDPCPGDSYTKDVGLSDSASLGIDLHAMNTLEFVSVQSVSNMSHDLSWA